MEIKFRTIKDFMEVKVIEKGIIIDLGLFNTDERIALAKVFIQGAEYLMPRDFENTRIAEKILGDVRESI